MVKTAHAFGFLVLGWVMQLLPAILPNQFPPSAFGIENTSAAWVRFMGWINVGLGVLFVLNLQVLPFLARMMAWRPQALPSVVRASQAAKAAAARMPNNILRPALRLEAKMNAAMARPEMARVKVTASRQIVA